MFSAAEPDALSAELLGLLCLFDRFCIRKHLHAFVLQSEKRGKKENESKQKDKMLVDKLSFNI